MHQIRRPLFYPFIGLIAGIITGNYFDFHYNILLSSLIVILFLLLLSQRKKLLVAGYLLICCFACVLGIFNIQKQQYWTATDQHISRYTNTGKLTAEAVVIESPSAYPDKNILILRCVRLLKNGDYIPVSGNIRLVIPPDLTFSYGDFIRFHTVLKKIHSFQNPGGFNYERYLNRQGIYATGFIANSSGIILLRKNSASGIRFALESFRMYLKQIIYNNSPSPQREIIEAITIGNQTGIPANIRDAFNKTGTSHILSISGLHVGMIAAIAFFFINALLKSSEYLMLRFNIIKVSAVGAFLLILFYACIAGMGVPVFRSALMALVVLIALIFGKQKDLYNTLALAGLVILIISPEALFDISFQLSFLAVLALIYIIPQFSEPFFLQNSLIPAWSQIIIRYFYMAILVCLSATIGTLPLLIYYFNQVSAVTIIANLIAVPLLGTLTLAITMAFLLTALFSQTVAALFIQLAAFFVQISIEIINKLASLSWSSFTVTKPNIPEIILLYIFLTLIIRLISIQKDTKGYWQQHPLLLRYALLSILLFFIADALYLSLKDKINTDLRITAIDVGQGSAILVRFPGGRNMLIDGGGFVESSFDTGRAIIAPYLYHERISRIDTIILTHQHPDHLLGLLYILDNFNVQEFWCTQSIVADEDYSKLQKIIAQRKISRVYLSKDLPERKIANVEINFLWPPGPSGLDAKKLSDADLNDSSLVIKIKYGKVAFLITGDISSYVETALIESGRDLKSDVLFVPHHGSRHSSSIDFIRTVACRYAVVSSGKDNSFRHPHPLILDRYRAEKVQVMRTDQDGAVLLTTDGVKLSVHTFVKHR